MLMDEVDDLSRYWAKFPPAHESLRLGLIGWGIWSPPAEDAGTAERARPTITDDELAQAAALREKWGSA